MAALVVALSAACGGGDDDGRSVRPARAASTTTVPAPVPDHHVEGFGNCPGDRVPAARWQGLTVPLARARCAARRMVGELSAPDGKVELIDGGALVARFEKPLGRLTPAGITPVS